MKTTTQCPTCLARWTAELDDLLAARHVCPACRPATPPGAPFDEDLSMVHVKRSELAGLAEERDVALAMAALHLATLKAAQAENVALRQELAELGRYRFLSLPA